jgi:HK97 family phage portal protein
MKFADRFRALAAALFGASDPLRRRGQAFISPQQADMWVDDRTALTFSAYWCAIRIVSEALMSLDWSVFEATSPDGKKERKTDIPVARLIQYKANPELAARNWREIMMRWALGWGNAYSEIERDGSGRAIALWPIHPTRVYRMLREDGVLGYHVETDDFGRVFLPWRDMFHLKGPGDDQFFGLSVVQLASRTIGTGIAGDQLQANFVANGANLSGVLSHPKRLSEEARKNIAESWKEAYAGPKKAGKTALLEEGVTYTATSVNPKDAELLAARQFTVEDIARWFRVPTHKLMRLERATHGNVEQMGVEFVSDTVLPWAVRLESEADIKLLRLDKQFTRLDLNTLMRGDMAGRGTYYQLMRNIGVYSANDIRRMEDQNPIGPAGDKYVMQSAMTTLEKIGEEPAPGAGDAGDPADGQGKKAKQPNGPGREDPGGRPANLSIVHGARE